MDDLSRLQRIMSKNKYVYQDRSDTPCVLCGRQTTIRIGNSLLDTSNPQCVNEEACLQARTYRARDEVSADLASN